MFIGTLLIVATSPGTPYSLWLAFTWDSILAVTRIHHSESGVLYEVRLTHDPPDLERWGAGVETQKNVREEIGGWGRVPFNEPYAPSLSTIYDGA